MNRRSGRWFVILGVFGIVVGVATIAIGWILVGSGSDAFERSLDLSSDAIATVGDTVELADVTVESVMDALFTTESALGPSRSTIRRSTSRVIPLCQGSTRTTSTLYSRRPVKPRTAWHSSHCATKAPATSIPRPPTSC